MRRFVVWMTVWLSHVGARGCGYVVWLCVELLPGVAICPLLSGRFLILGVALWRGCVWCGLMVWLFRRDCVVLVARGRCGGCDYVV